MPEVASGALQDARQPVVSVSGEALFCQVPRNSRSSFPGDILRKQQFPYNLARAIENMRLVQKSVHKLALFHVQDTHDALFSPKTDSSGIAFRAPLHAPPLECSLL